MRMARLIGVGESQYHCMSRVIERRFLLGDEEKEQFLDLMRRAEGFCDVTVCTYALMDNHFHLLVDVPEKEVWIDDEELLRRMGFLYSPKVVQATAAEIRRLRSEGRDGLADMVRDKYTYRMHDISEFMKTLKQRFTQWYNRRNDRHGTLWEQRFKSVLVEESENALATMAAYIDLNPVRALLAEDPKDYRYSGYAEALAGSWAARAGLTRLVEAFDCKVDGWETAAAEYRKHLFCCGCDKPISPEKVAQVLEEGGRLTRGELLRCRLRYLTDGLVLGGRSYVEQVFQRNRAAFGYRRRNGAQPLEYGDWGGLCTMRNLKRPPIIINI